MLDDVIMHVYTEACMSLRWHVDSTGTTSLVRTVRRSLASDTLHAML